MMRYVVVGMFLAASGSAAHAGNSNPLNPSITDSTISAIGPTAPRTIGFQPRTVPLTNFSVYTGVATAGGVISLLESAATPTFDDVVTIGNINDPINNYVAAAGGIFRYVTSTTSVDINGFAVLTIQISGRDVAGGAADLWPSGFSNAGNQASQGAFAFGLAGMPASLGGTVPINTAPLNFVNRMSIQLITDGVLGAESLVPASAYGNGPTQPWNGSITRFFPNAAVGPAVTSDIIVRITLVPTPGAAAVLGMGGLLAARRRRR